MITHKGFVFAFLLFNLLLPAIAVWIPPMSVQCFEHSDCASNCCDLELNMCDNTPETRLRGCRFRSRRLRYVKREDPPPTTTAPSKSTAPPESSAPPPESTAPPKSTAPPESSAPPPESTAPPKSTAPPESSAPPPESTAPPKSTSPPKSSAPPPESTSPPPESSMQPQESPQPTAGQGGAGKQYITGPCSRDTDCLSGCCGFNTGVCEAPLDTERAGGCGRGDSQPNWSASMLYHETSAPTP
ncbi:hypothetical protein D8B26_007865 [Coccidioides posadasii str. Silveira]|nr:hypothetical protein D8B26_007865 [Coccidioides posadasii str. Silveira]